MTEFLLNLAVDWLLFSIALFAVYKTTALAIRRSSSGAISEWKKHLNTLKCPIEQDSILICKVEKTTHIVAAIDEKEQSKLQMFLNHHYDFESASKRLGLIKSWPRFLVGSIIVGLLIAAVVNYSLLYGNESIKQVAPNIEKLIFLFISLIFVIAISMPHINGFNDLKDAAQETEQAE